MREDWPTVVLAVLIVLTVLGLVLLCGYPNVVLDYLGSAS
jgi:hypothetical protein